MTILPTETSAPFWEARQAGEFKIQRCLDCDTWVFYPRLLCTKCHSRKLEWVTASGDAVVCTFTVIHRAPSPDLAERVPYVLAMVDLKEGPRVLTNIVGCRPEEVHVGMRVQVDFSGDQRFPLFKPAQAS